MTKHIYIRINPDPQSWPPKNCSFWQAGRRQKAGGRMGKPIDAGEQRRRRRSEAQLACCKCFPRTVRHREPSSYHAHSNKLGPRPYPHPHILILVECCYKLPSAASSVVHSVSLPLTPAHPHPYPHPH